MWDPIGAAQFIRTWGLVKTAAFSIANHIDGGFVEVGMYGQGEDLLKALDGLK